MTDVRACVHTHSNVLCSHLHDVLSGLLAGFGVMFETITLFTVSNWAIGGLTPVATGAETVSESHAHYSTAGIVSIRRFVFWLFD